MESFKKDTRVRDVSGRLEYSIHKGEDRDLVLDRTGRLLGFTDSNSTYSRDGRKVVIGPQPGLLFDKK